MPKVQQAQADLGIIRTPELARVTVKKRKGATIVQYCTFDIFLVKDIIVQELKLAPVPNLFYSICMMCDGRFIWEILYGCAQMGPR